MDDVILEGHEARVELLDITILVSYSPNPLITTIDGLNEGHVKKKLLLCVKCPLPQTPKTSRHVPNGYVEQKCLFLIKTPLGIYEVP